MPRITHIGDIVSRNENLSDRLFQNAKQLIPQRDQPALPDRRESLFLSDSALLCACHGGEPHPVQAHADSSGRHYDDAVPERAKRRACLGDGRECRNLRKEGRLWVQDRRRAWP